MGDVERTYCCPQLAGAADLDCENHTDAFDCPDVLVVQDLDDGAFGLPVRDGGTSFVTFDFCPWCGSNVRPQSELVAEAGIEPAPALPPAALPGPCVQGRGSHCATPRAADDTAGEIVEQAIANARIAGVDVDSPAWRTILLLVARGLVSADDLIAAHTAVLAGAAAPTESADGMQETDHG